jgi:hypothetical protein
MKLLFNAFKVRLLRQFFNIGPYLYMFLSKHTNFPNDLQPPSPVDSTNENYSNVSKEMIVAKYINPSTDMSIVIPKIEWSTNTIFTEYTHKNSMYDKNFYVAVSSGTTYDVFKCLFNNANTPSTFSPSLVETSASDDIYETADGYIWKYMYSSNNATYNKFSTQEFMPVSVNPDVSSNAVNGSIDVVKTLYGGSNYDSVTSGLFASLSVEGNNLVYALDPTLSSSNTGFYNGSAIKIVTGTGAGQQKEIVSYNVTGASRLIKVDSPFSTALDDTSSYEISPRVGLIGDGIGFQARALVNTSINNAIYKIEITNRGAGYTYANPVIFANTGGFSNAAVIETVISPSGGHGYDPVYELGAKHLCISTTFNSKDGSNLNKLFDVNNFRSIGVINRPLFSNVHIEYENSAGTFRTGDTLVQPSTNASGTIASVNSSIIALTNVFRHFYYTSNTYIQTSDNSANANIVSVRNNASSNLTSEMIYSDQTVTFNITGSSGDFILDEVVTSSSIEQSSAFVYFANSSVVKVTNVKGTFLDTITGLTSGSVASIASIKPSDFVPNSGELLYIENIPPINKFEDQTETIKTIIEF